MNWESVRNPRRTFSPTYKGSLSNPRDGHRSVDFESMLEEDWLVRELAFDLKLRRVVSQPRVDAIAGGLPYRLDGKERIWIPDFVRQRRGRPGLQDPAPVLVEVKPLISIYPEDRDDEVREEKRAQVREKFEVIRMAALTRGYGFELATENEIRIQPGLDNAAFMLRTCTPLFPRSWEKIGEQAVIELPRSSSIPELQKVLPKGVDALSVALWLAFSGQIVLDPKRKWTRATKFARA
ncbi:hypothetical protein ABIF69_004486 [Bradyrhizobium japonicum]